MIILGGVYFNYFANNNKISLESSEKNIETQVEENESKKKEAKVLNEQTVDKTKINENEEVKELKNEEVKELFDAIEKNNNQVHEAADVLYHLLVLLEGSGVKIEDVMTELKKRQNEL